MWTPSTDQSPNHNGNKTSVSNKTPSVVSTTNGELIRLSKLISAYGKNMQMSRRSAEALVRDGLVTIAGNTVTDPSYQISIYEAMQGGGIVKVNGNRLLFPIGEGGLTSSMQYDFEQTTNKGTDLQVSTPFKTRVWIAHKLPGELVADFDPEGRPTLLERLKRGGVGKPSRKAFKSGQTSLHLKAVGRLDMLTEGLILVTNDGGYAREMELPVNRLHRTYRARVHGLVTLGKLDAMRKGLEIDGIRYKGMKVNLEMTRSGTRTKGGGTNSWLRITCCEGKNRQIRKVLDHLGCESLVYCYK